MVSVSNPNPKQLLFLVFLLPFLASVLSAQTGGFPSESIDTGLGGNNSITGTVLNPSGQRISTRVRIRLSTMTRGNRITMTDDDGNFSFRGLPSGNYTLVIDKEKDFEPFTDSVEIIQLRGSPPQVYNLNIRLKFKGNTDPKPGVLNSELANVPKRARNYYAKAGELARKGDHKAAVAQLQLAISEYPEFMLAFNELGVQYLRLNELEKADESFRAALKIKPEAFAPLVNRGIVLVMTKRYEEAEPLLRNALKIEEKSAAGHYFLGQTLANLGRFEDAEKELAAAVGLGGDEVKEAHRLLAIIYSTRGDKKRAADELEIYLRLFPTTPDAEQLRKVIRQLRDSEPPAPESKPSP